VREKQTSMPGKKGMRLYDRIRQILESARFAAARSVNTAQVVANWLIGREIVEEEQRGSNRAEYGQQLIFQLSEQLKTDFGTGYSVQNLFYMRQFYQTYPSLVPNLEILHALRRKSDIANIPDALPWQLTVPAVPPVLEICHALGGKSLGSALDTGQILAGRHPQSGQALNSYQEIVALVPP